MTGTECGPIFPCSNRAVTDLRNRVQSGAVATFFTFDLQGLNNSRMHLSKRPGGSFSSPTLLGGISHEEVDSNCSLHHCFGSRSVSYDCVCPTGLHIPST